MDAEWRSLLIGIACTLIGIIYGYKWGREDREESGNDG